MSFVRSRWTGCHSCQVAQDFGDTTVFENERLMSPKWCVQPSPPRAGARTSHGSPSLAARVKQYNSGFILNPACLAPRHTVEMAQKLQARNWCEQWEQPKEVFHFGLTCCNKMRFAGRKPPKSRRISSLSWCLDQSFLAVDWRSLSLGPQEDPGWQYSTILDSLQVFMQFNHDYRWQIIHDPSISVSIATHVCFSKRN